MNKARLIFIILSIYIVVAFGWWTYAHIDSARKIRFQQKDVLEMRCYKATFDLQGAVEQEMFNDSLDLRKYFDANFPDLEVVFLNIHDPLNNFMVRPRLESYTELDTVYERRVKMYLMEGLVMMVMLFWGIMVIYRSFKKELHLKRQQTNFLLSVTHELKTPLTAMKLYMETLLKRNMNPDQVKTIAANSLQEANRLHDQVEKLLLSAQLDSHRYQLNKVSTNLTELVQEFTDSFNRPRAESEWVKTELQDQVIALVDPSAIEMILNNLLTNAEKYAGKDAGVKVCLTQDNHHVMLRVCDEGPGIDDAVKKNLFNKFYRAGDENTRKTKGTGLGLFIVSHLVELHGGNLSVHNNQPKGTIFEIKFRTDAVTN